MKPSLLRHLPLLFSAWLLATTLPVKAVEGFLESLGPLTNSKKEPVEAASLPKTPLIGLYFSASWCTPCRIFTPELIAFANSHPDLQVLLVSLDQSEGSQLHYMTTSKMPWPALSFSNPNRSLLPTTLGIYTYPSLLIFSSEGNLLTRNGRELTKDPALFDALLEKAQTPSSHQ